jgi:predicted PurR-regulated permease PerM
MNTPDPVFPATDVPAASRLSTLVGFVVVITALYLGRPVLIPLAFAVVFAFWLTPLVDLLEKCRLGRVPSVLAVLAVAFALIGFVGWGVTNQLMQIMGKLPDYSANIHRKIEAVHTPSESGLGRATATVNQMSKELTAASETAGNERLGRNQSKQPISVQVATPPRTAAEYLRDVVGPLTGILETSAIVVILTLFILVRRQDLRNRMLRLAGRPQLHLMTQAIDEGSTRLGHYLLLQLAVNAGYGLLFGLGVYIIGIPNALLWGAFASILRFVPYIGTLASAAFPMAMAVAVFPGWTQAGLIFALFIALELGVANLIEPWLVGSHTGVSPLAILVAAIFWGMLWGPAGLVLSTPLTLCLILIGRYVPQLRFLDILLGDEPVLSTPAHFYQRLLAFDEDEAKEIADKYLKENPIGSIYESVLVPALLMAEQDRHMNVVDERRTSFIHQSISELIDEMHEASRNKSAAADKDLSPATLSPLTGPRIVCVPVRDEADAIVGRMLAQLLQHAGHDAYPLDIGPVSTMLQQIEELKANVVCLSALPPLAAGHAKSLCRQVRQRFPDVRIVLGLWESPGGTAKVQERLGGNCADLIGTSLLQIVSLIGEVTVAAGATAHSIPDSAYATIGNDSTR